MSEPLAVTISAAADLLGISRTEMFRLVRDGAVRTFVLPGRKTRLISTAWLREYVAQQVAEQAGEQSVLDEQLRAIVCGRR